MDSSDVTGATNSGAGSQFSLRALLAVFSAACVFFGLVSWDLIAGAVAFCFVMGSLLLGCGIGLRRPGLIAVGAVLATFSVAYVLVDQVGVFPVLGLATFVSVFLAFANTPERPHETWLALTALLACGVLGAVLYCDRFEVFPAYNRKDYFLTHLCAGLISGIIVTTPYVLIRIVLTKTIFR